MGDGAIGDPIKWRQNRWGSRKSGMEPLGTPKMGTEPLGDSEMGNRVIGDPINQGWSHCGPHKMEAKSLGIP